MADWRPTFPDNSQYGIAAEFIRVESPPAGCEPLPEDGGPISAFATSYRLVSMEQLFPIRLSQEIMELMGPFEVRFSVM